MRTATWVCAFMVFAMSLGGCGGKRAECKKLISMVDDDDEAIKKLDTSGDDLKVIGASMRQVATIETKLAADLAKEKWKTAELQKFSADYQAFATEVAGDATEVGTVLDQIVALQGKVDATSATSLMKPWSDAVDKMVARCNAHQANGCVQVGQIFKRLPSNPKDNDAYGVALDKAAADMKKVAISDPILKADVADLDTKTADLAKLMHDLSDIEKRAKAAQAKMGGIDAKETALNAQINTFCGAN